MILALQSSDSSTHIGLYDTAGSSEPVASINWESGRELSAHLLDRIVQFLSDNKTTLGGLTGIIIYSGPGSFTSLRIGHSAVNALADSLDIPVVGAGGVDWVTTGLSALTTARSHEPALPLYGAEANITKSQTRRGGPKS